MPPKKRAKRAQNDPWSDQPASPGLWDQPGEDDPWRFVCCSKFLDAWASLTLMERSHLLRCCYQENCQKQDESGVSGVPGVQWNICGQSVCFQCFCKVLGSMVSSFLVACFWSIGCWQLAWGSVTLRTIPTANIRNFD